MEVEAELVHRCHRGSHRPSRPGTLPRQAHGRHDRRGKEQPRGHAVAATTRDRCDPKSGKSRSGHGTSVKCPFLSPRVPAPLNLARSECPPPILPTPPVARTDRLEAQPHETATHPTK